MRVLGWTGALVAVTMLIGCGGGGGGATPEETFKKLKAALTDKKFEDVWAMLSSASQEYYDDYAKNTLAEKATKALDEGESQARIDLENQAKAMGIELKNMKKLDGKGCVVGVLTMASKNDKNAWARFSRAEFVREEINGDRAEVYLKVDDVPDAVPVPLVLEGGKWKVDFRDVPKPPAKPE